MAERRDERIPTDEVQVEPRRAPRPRRERRREHGWDVQEAASFRFPRS